MVANQLLDEDFMIPALIAASILLGLLIKTVASVIRATSRERTRREIAAYIAEGSMSPEQGERLLRAGEKRESV
ncbi:MAG TPA: hypothetical protein VD963_08950 [Phycisphaerales bacterium]|nr:hypothetical protein [Phycisphaerales bacterium]